MTNQSTVPHTQISLRLAICSEFLLDEEKSIKETYQCWMRRMGGRIIEFAEFEFWYRRFQNNQFDLGYDTSQDSKRTPEIQMNTMNSDPSEDLDRDAVSKIQNTMNPEAKEVKDVSTMTTGTEASVKIVEKQMEDLKLDHQFNENNIPQIFQNLINGKSEDLSYIKAYLTGRDCTMHFHGIRICWMKEENEWMVCYPSVEAIIGSYGPERSIIDHLWFLLRDPNISLSYFYIVLEKNAALELKDHNFQELDLEMVNTLLQSMFNTFDHQIHTSSLCCSNFNENTCLAMLKQVKPGTLETIDVDILWKEEGNYQRMKEIVETDQWNQAKKIVSLGVHGSAAATWPRKIRKFFHFDFLTCIYLFIF